MTPRDESALGVRLVWLALLSVHVTLAGLALHFLPQGFPLFHARSVVSTLAPASIALGSVGLGVVLVTVPRVGVRWIPALPAFWAGLALGLLLVFPATGALAARTLGLVALFLFVVAWFACRKCALRELVPAAVVGAASGVLVARCERPPLPSTQPSGGVPPHTAVPGSPAPARLELGPGVVLETSPLGLIWHGRQASVVVEPALEFDRTSPDGFWSIFTDATRPAPAVVSATSAAGAFQLWAADGTQILRAERDGALVRLDAWTVLDRPVYSHLNSFTTVRINGHRRLGLRFSPCSSVTVEVTHADYPAGAPARFAYVDSSRWLHVVQATDAEKGPFSPIAQGLLRPGEPLGIDLVELDGGARPFARVEFADFTAELSTALSPTAGYGVSENAVEFGLAAVDARSPAQLLLTLAASGVGRGWDSVGHRAGAYRNRVSLLSLEPPPEPGPPVDAATVRTCQDVARDIAALSPRFPELVGFDPTRVLLHLGECSLEYGYRTHPSTQRGGWRAQVPEPDAGGIWFHLGIWDPNSHARREQINSQPGFSVFALGERNVTVLILDGTKQGRLADALWQLLRRHGVEELRR